METLRGFCRTMTWRQRKSYLICCLILRNVCYLKMEVAAAVIDTGRQLVEETYLLEGDGPLLFKGYIQRTQ